MRLPLHHVGHHTSEEGSLHALVLEGESSQKSFPDFEGAQLLIGGVGVEDSDGVGEP